MLYRTMKKNGDSLSVLGFGAMRMPQKGNKINEEEAVKQIYYAIDHGVNYIDTAMPYHMGKSEPFLGKILNNGYKDKVKVATKLPPWSVKKKQDMDDLFLSQLNSLQTECIDYYLLHGLDKIFWTKFKDLGVIEFMDRIKKQGRIKNMGFSFHGDLKTFKQIVDEYDWQFCQIQYNYLDEENQAGKEGLQYAAGKDLGIIVMEPLRGGNLARKPPEDVNKIWQEADQKRSPAEWSLRWIWDQPEVTVVLSGMNSMEQIQENIKIANEAEPKSLTKKETEILNKAKTTFRKQMKISCTGCHYCMPCPSNVHIPGCFELYNSLHTFGDKTGSKIMYFFIRGGVIGSGSSYASLCKECGECEKHCPQHLPIQETLKLVKKDFEGFFFRFVIWIGNSIMAGQRKKTLKKAKKIKKQEFKSP